MSSGTRGGSAAGRDDHVEFLHGWGGNSDMVVTLADGFEGENPGITVEEVHEPNVSLETKSRILKRDPPDAWAAWVGPNLDPYQNVGVLADLDDVWARNRMEQEYHEAAKDAVHRDGAYRAVPLNIQHTNLLYWDVERVEQAGVDPTAIDDPWEFIEVLEQVDDALDVDAFLMAFLQPFASQGLYMWECLYLGMHGSGAYRDLVEGRSETRRDEIRETLRLFDRLFDFANDDAINLTDQLEDQRFVNGEAAFRFQGMWSALGMSDRDYEYETEWDAGPIPGSEGTQLINMDGLIMPKNPPHPESAREFMAYAGSQEGIERFNRHKQSIPPRADVSMDGLSDFIREETRHFQRARDHLPSIAHGFGVQPEILIDLEVPFSRFVVERDVEATMEEIVGVLGRVA